MSLTKPKNRLSKEKYKAIKYLRTALESEYKHLVKHPELLWQQLYNKLQWPGQEEKGIMLTELIETELARKSLPHSGPWFHNRVPSRIGKPIKKQTTDLNDFIFHIKFNQTDKKVYTADHGGRIKIWDVGTGAIDLVFRAHKRPITVFALSPDGKKLVTAANDNKLIKWDAESGKKITELKGYRGAISDCAFSPDGEFMATAGEDHSVRLWDAKTAKRKKILTRHNKMVNCCQFSPDGKLLASAGIDNRVILWDMPSGRFKAEMIGHVRPVTGCLFSSNGRYLVSKSQDLTVRIWDLVKFEEVAILTPQTKEYSYYIVRGGGQGIASMAFSRDSNLLATGGYDSLIKIWDVYDGSELKTFNVHEHPAVECIFSCNDNFLFSVSGDSTIRAWDLSLGLPLVHFPSTGPISCSDISSDGKMLAAGDTRGNIYILEMVNFENIITGLEQYSTWRKKVFYEQNLKVKEKGPPCYKDIAPQAYKHRKTGPGFMQGKAKFVWHEYLVLIFAGAVIASLAWIIAGPSYWLIIISIVPLYFYVKMWKLVINERLYRCAFCGLNFSFHRRYSKDKTKRYKCPSCSKYNFL